MFSDKMWNDVHTLSHISGKKEVGVMFIKMTNFSTKYNLKVFQREKHMSPTPVMFHPFLSTMNAFQTTCFVILIIWYVDVVYHVRFKGVST